MYHRNNGSYFREPFYQNVYPYPYQNYEPVRIYPTTSDPNFYQNFIPEQNYSYDQNFIPEQTPSQIYRDQSYYQQISEQNYYQADQTYYQLDAYPIISFPEPEITRYENCLPENNAELVEITNLPLNTPEPALDLPSVPEILLPPTKPPVEKQIIPDIIFTSMVNDIMKLKFKKWKLLYYDNAKTPWDYYLEWATYNKNLRVCLQIYELPNWVDNIFYSSDDHYTETILTNGREFTLSQLFMLAKLQDRRQRKLSRGKSLSMRYQFPYYIYTMTSREILEKHVNNDGPVVTFEYLQHATTNDFLVLVKNVDDNFKKSLIRFVRTRAKHKLRKDLE